ncbi:hypothetical protein K431DRAFT_289751 [Polychaeton citri CBS 116435]|uniref:Prion-inhibition and propagation HeLo domain-containing protein n=1 Tax=Polychaeton citri CBS 116435 TaxID=1314669 RepID=A0A9P4PW44_9PEZI|nr:hypothetical protein K431DRAFT_289751 [Polychaeton citri CBS 116435]
MSADTVMSSVLGVPGALNAVIQTCQAIQFGRRFNGDFALSSAKLQITGLQLAQWGQAVGIIEMEDGESTTRLSNTDQQKAMHILSKILQAFASAKEQCRKYAEDDSRDDLDTEIIPSTKSADRMILAIRTRTNQYRINPISSKVIDKARWVIYRKSQFEKLVGDIRAATNELIEIFPAQKSEQRTLCARDLSDLDTDDLKTVESIADDLDDLDLQKVAQSVASSRGLRLEGNTVRSGVIDMGNEYSTAEGAKGLQSITVRRNDFSGNSVSRFGHSVGVSRTTYRPN